MYIMAAVQIYEFCITLLGKVPLIFIPHALPSEIRISCVL